LDRNRQSNFGSETLKIQIQGPQQNQLFNGKVAVGPGFVSLQKPDGSLIGTSAAGRFVFLHEALTLPITFSATV
jgi:hypothetical protein